MKFKKYSYKYKKMEKGFFLVILSIFLVPEVSEKTGDRLTICCQAVAVIAIILMVIVCISALYTARDSASYNNEYGSEGVDSYDYSSVYEEPKTYSEQDYDIQNYEYTK